jgi:hypothetical protein
MDLCSVWNRYFTARYSRNMTSPFRHRTDRNGLSVERTVDRVASRWALTALELQISDDDFQLLSIMCALENILRLCIFVKLQRHRLGLVFTFWMRTANILEDVSCPHALSCDDWRYPDRNYHHLWGPISKMSKTTTKGPTDLYITKLTTDEHLPILDAAFLPAARKT